MSQKPQMFPIERIIRDAGTQMREKINQNTVNDYADVMNDGNELPPLLVFRTTAADGTDSNYLVEGFHRIIAHEKLGHKVVPVEIRPGTLRDAILHAIGDNATHGLPRTNADKRKAVSTMLCDAEWSQLSDSEIARRALVSQPFVGNMRKEFAPPAPIAPVASPAADKGSTGTQGELSLSAPAESVPTRKVTRGGKEYTMRPANASTKRKAAEKGKPFTKFNEKMKAALTLIKQGNRAMKQTCEFDADKGTFGSPYAKYLSASIVTSIDTLLGKIEDNLPGAVRDDEPGFVTVAKHAEQLAKDKARADAAKGKDVKAGPTGKENPLTTSATLKADRLAKVAKEKAEKAKAASDAKPDDEKLKEKADAALADAKDAAEDARKAHADAAATASK